MIAALTAAVALTLPPDYFESPKAWCNGIVWMSAVMTRKAWEREHEQFPNQVPAFRQGLPRDVIIQATQGVLTCRADGTFKFEPKVRP